MKEESRNRIVLFSFVLTVFVIWLHAGECLISSIPGQIAVPGFFILSGFLFFRGIPSSSGKGKETFLPAWMKEKLKRRYRTLLIPYLLWNFLYFAAYLVCGKAELTEFFSAVFLYSCNPVFWYLEQLILITLVTPLLYLLMKEKRTAAVWLGVIFFLAVFYGRIHSVIDIRFINEDALFYYSFGAFLSLHNIYKEEKAAVPHIYKEEKSGVEPLLQETADVPEKAAFFAEWKKVLITAAILLVFDLLSYILPDALKNIGVIGLRTSGAILVWFMIERLPEVRVRPWMKITFFIYATHYLLLRLVWLLENALGLGGSAFANVITYLMMPAVCVSAAYGIFIVMKKYTPKFLGLLTGNRGTGSN